MKMSNILEYFVTVDSVRCQCVFCGKCFTLDSPVEIREKHLETEHPQGFAKIKTVAQRDKPSNQGYASDEETSFQNRSEELPRYYKNRSKVWYYFKRNADKTRNICNICSQTLFNNKGSTGNMWKHLNDKHDIKKEKILDSKIENPVEYISEESPYKSNISKENRAFLDSQKEKPIESISEYILKSDMRSTRNISNVRIYCKDGVVSTHKVLLASISKCLSDLFKENNDVSDIILPDFNMKDVLLGLENFVSVNDGQTTNEILKLLLGKRQYTAFSNDDLIMEVFDENTIEHDQEEGDEATSDCSFNKGLLEDYTISVSDIKTTNGEKMDHLKVLRNLQNYFFIFDSFNGSSICKRCGKTFRSNQDFSVMVQHMNNCEQKQN